LDPIIVYGRLNRGWTLERALTTKPPQRGANVAALARERGMNIDTVRSRINKQGLSLQMALNRPLQRVRNNWAERRVINQWRGHQ
jgi:hypothetical protein